MHCLCGFHWLGPDLLRLPLTTRTHAQLLLYEPIVFKNEGPPGSNYLATMTAKRKFLFADHAAVHSYLADKVGALGASECG